MMWLNSAGGTVPRVLWTALWTVAVALGLAVGAPAQDPSTAPVRQHKVYQAVDAQGNSTYLSSLGQDAFPVRLRGVVLNDNEDWLDPTQHYNTTPWDLGGETEFFVQSVNLDAYPDWDDDPDQPYDDFGGTAAWMGQCYENLGFIDDPDLDIRYPDGSDPPQASPYSPPGWYYELDRLGYWRPGTPLEDDELIRRGDLIEIQARGGLNYAGKMNVNEQHNTVTEMDFELVILQKQFGLPQPMPVTLSDIKHADDTPIFDPTRATGGEHYQATLVEMQNVTFVETDDWGSDNYLELTDETGRTLDVYLGLDDSFDSMPAPAGYFDVVGIVDQLSSTATACRDGYRLLVMSAADFSAVPEPASTVLWASGAAAGLLWLARRRRTRLR